MFIYIPCFNVLRDDILSRDGKGFLMFIRTQAYQSCPLEDICIPRSLIRANVEATFYTLTGVKIKISPACNK